MCLQNASFPCHLTLDATFMQSQTEGLLYFSTWLSMKNYLFISLQLLQADLLEKNIEHKRKKKLLFKNQKYTAKR